MREYAGYLMPRTETVLAQISAIKALSWLQKTRLFQAAQAFFDANPGEIKYSRRDSLSYSVLKAGENLIAVFDDIIFDASKNGIRCRGKLAFNQKGEILFLKEQLIPKISATVDPDAREYLQDLIRNTKKSFASEIKNAFDYGEALYEFPISRDSQERETLYMIMKFRGFTAVSFVDPELSLSNPIKLSNMEFMTAAVQSVQGVIGIHRKGKVHRDIKLENLLIQFEPIIAVSVTDFEHLAPLNSEGYYFDEDCPTKSEYLPRGYDLIRAKRCGAATDIFAGLVAAEKLLNQCIFTAESSIFERTKHAELSEFVFQKQNLIHESMLEEHNQGHPFLSETSIDELEMQLEEMEQNLLLPQLKERMERQAYLSQIYNILSEEYTKLYTIKIREFSNAQENTEVDDRYSPTMLADQYAREHIMIVLKFNQDYKIILSCLRGVPHLDAVNYSNHADEYAKKFKQLSLFYWLIKFKKECLNSNNRPEFKTVILIIKNLLKEIEKLSEVQFDNIARKIYETYETLDFPEEALKRLKGLYASAKLYHQLDTKKFRPIQVAKAAGYIAFQRTNIQFLQESESFQQYFMHHEIPEFFDYEDAQNHFLSAPNYLLGIELYVEYYVYRERFGEKNKYTLDYRKKWIETYVKELVDRLYNFFLIHRSVETLGRIFNDALIDGLLGLYLCAVVLDYVSNIVLEASQKSKSIFIAYKIIQYRFLECVYAQYFSEPGFFDQFFEKLRYNVINNVSVTSFL